MQHPKLRDQIGSLLRFVLGLDDLAGTTILRVVHGTPDWREESWLD